MIDMHIHTTHSDGLPTVSEILTLAEEKKLDYIAFTDHDAVGAYNELKSLDYKKLFSGKIVTGCELRFVYNRMQMEVLGFGFDFEKIKDNYWVNKESYHAIKKAILNNCLTKGREVGFKFKDFEYDPNEKSEKIFYKELLKYEENLPILQKFNVNHSGEFFRKMVASDKSPMYFDPTDYSLSFEDAVDLIHSCGGVALLAHPFGVYNIENPKEVLNELLSKNKLDGLECYHANMTPEQTKYLLDICEKNNLLSSGGSDYHNYPGQSFAKANFGKDDIPTSAIEKLLKKIDNKNIL